ncbi:MAG: tryptophan synthase alpha chain, partial [Myxococcales bacterium]|nr:tryptophan synthase alpha chain [Myxococcales bacterium]
SPNTCGGGGTANVCGCTPTSCAAQGKNCGSIPNGCGGTLNCGTCTAPSTCTNNVCTACVPNPDPCPSSQCAGTASDGCGGTVSCTANCGLAGECPCAGGHCAGNYCSCNPGPCL